jgi:hypothetical protein
MQAYEEALEITARLSLGEKALLLEHLSGQVKQALTTEAYKHMPWEQFLALTYGSLANDPLERNQPQHPDIRDEIE